MATHSPRSTVRLMSHNTCVRFAPEPSDLLTSRSSSSGIRYLPAENRLPFAPREPPPPQLAQLRRRLDPPGHRVLQHPHAQVQQEPDRPDGDDAEDYVLVLAGVLFLPTEPP